MALLRGDADAEIGRHLLREEGEVIVDVVRKHWVVYWAPVALVVLGSLLVYVAALAPPDIAWLPMLAGFLGWGFAWYRAKAAELDRFVITNMRVFRMKGVFSRSTATMPLGRILDITVVKPMHGRILGFGHFTFESAAREQGLRDITYVGRPDERDLTIQRVVQRAGLRGPRVPN